MLFSEAAKTGRPFQRKSEPGIWYFLEGKAIIKMDRGANIAEPAQIDAEMVVASDWDPQPLKLELTAEDIKRAARGLDELVSKRKLSAAEFAHHLSIELGLINEPRR